MKLTYHGGLCCGVKTIYGLGESPAAIIPARAETNHCILDGGNESPGESFFYREAPAETYLERLDRYIECCDVRRKHGIIEITLAKGPTFDQLKPWRKLLEERGFVAVTDCHNSNSGNRVYIFHRKTDIAA